MNEFEHEPVETGIVEAFTATVKEPEGLSQEGLEALKQLVTIPADKSTPHFLIAVARDVAMDIHTVDHIIAKHGLTNAQYERLAKYNDFFKAALAQQAGEWQRLGSTQERIKAQAAAALEEQMPVLASRMGARGEKLADTVEAAKLFAKMAGVDSAPGTGASGGERFTINIDLGADQHITVRSGVDPQAGTGPNTPAPLREIGKT